MLSTVLYFTQLGLMIVFGFAQLIKLAESTQGTSLTWTLLWEGFALINLALALQAQRQKPSRDNRRLIITYLGWSVVGASWFLVMAVKGTLSWNLYDTANVVLSGVLTGVTFRTAYRRGWYPPGAQARRLSSLLSDPRTRCCLALITKALPQAMMAMQILFGLPVVVALATVVIGHLTIFIRLGQTIVAGFQSRWDRNVVAILINESGNELSWIVFTVVWANY